ncbi:cyclin-dependent kinase inhibitor 1C-like [Bactrocera dorsalis]|uniref:Cyclin-dependent kinase inhibitor 1C-like n=1 Tax=Bactrocera dorsalis TaxID=27457 RepID=A0ABM3J174_BACDO|nr:cyclin-dependent kinase inhibitor 1C-like [Bactrocera dorsalis]
MDIDTPAANTSTARAATNVPRNGPTPAPRTIVATASAAAPATAPATTPAPVPATAPAAVLPSAPRGGTRPPPNPSQTSESRRISSSREVNRPPIHGGRIPRFQPSARAAPQRSGTSLRRCGNAITKVYLEQFRNRLLLITYAN